MSRLLFLMTRVGAAFLAAPLFGAMAVPVQVRIALAGAVGAFLWANPAIPVPGNIMTFSGLILLAGEVVIGLALGFVFQIILAIPAIAAELIGGSMGLGFARSIDPGSGVMAPALGQIFTVIAMLIFLGLDLHLLLIGRVVDSYAAFPPGAAWLGADRHMAIAQFGGRLFADGVLLAMPVAVLLLGVNLMTAIIGRAAPALNLFAIGLPASFLAGLMALALFAPDMAAVLTDMMVAGADEAGAITG